MMSLAGHAITVSSPFLHSSRAAEYGADSYWQHQLVTQAVSQFMEAPFERGIDIRGHKIEVHVHEDGLHVTVSEATEG